MLLDVAVSKIGKYATLESGDTLEMVERPHGGLSFVLVDGQRSGRGAKRISNMVARKAINLLSEGVRDGAVARAAHDYLFTHRQGQVSATLNIASIDMVSRTLVLSRNNHCPIYVRQQQELLILDEPSHAVGIHRHTKPIISEFELVAPMLVVIFTDGLQNAGRRQSKSLDIPEIVCSLAFNEIHSARLVADTLFNAAYELDQQRPIDDISLVVIAILEKPNTSVGRHLEVTIPL